MAELLGSVRRSDWHNQRWQLVDGSDRGALPPLWKSPGPCFRRWSASHRPAVLHERRGSYLLSQILIFRFCSTGLASYGANPFSIWPARIALGPFALRSKVRAPRAKKTRIPKGGHRDEASFLWSRVTSTGLQQQHLAFYAAWAADWLNPRGAGGRLRQ